jgi:glycine betaine/proline transport system ATP-binding protein
MLAHDNKAIADAWHTPQPKHPPKCERSPREDQSTSPVLRCRNLWKIFGADESSYRDAAVREPAELIQKLKAQGRTPAVANASFDVCKGEIFVIMGLSGSGKSTVVRCLSRLLEPTAGEVMFEDRDLLALSRRELMEIRRHKMGMVFQHFGLLPHLSVIENVAFPLKIQGVPEQQRLEAAARIVALVGLEGREGRYPNELSGGQQQRVGIARSLVVDPQLWLLDEPFSALDPLIRRQMQDEFIRLQKVLRKTIVFITHDFLEALRIADKVAIMKDGCIVQIGRPAELVLSPANSYVRSFTSDVPLVRVIRAEDIAEPPNGITPHRQVCHHATLDTILPLLSDSACVRVTDDDGRVIGDVTLHGALSALARAKQSSCSAGMGETIQ